MTTIFADGFESGTFGVWTSINTWGTGTINIINTDSHGGLYCAETSFSSPPSSGGTTYIYIAESTLLYTRMYIKFPSNLPVNGAYATFLQFIAPDNSAICQLELAPTSTGTKKIQLTSINGAIYEYNQYIFDYLPNVWYCFELHALIDSVAGAYTVWLNGLPIITLTGKNTSTFGNINRVQTGGQGEPGIAMTMRQDDIVIADSYIGPDTGVDGTLVLTATADTLPVSASFTVGGQTQTGTSATFTLPAGTYLATATYGGKTLSQNIIITSGQQTVYNFEFTTTPAGTLVLTATANGVPVSATFSVSAQTQTGTSATFTLSAGSYIASATYNNITLTQTVVVNSGQQTAFNFSFTVENGAVSVTAFSGSIPITANVTLNGQSGQTPYTFTVPAGTYTITAEYQGTVLPAQSITVVAGQTSNVVLQFPSAVITATLTVVAGLGGIVSPEGTFDLTVGSAYQFTATPTTGYNFDHWDLAGTNKGSSLSLILTATAEMDGQTLTALFTAIPPQQITMNLAVIGDGSTDMAPGQYQFNVGDTITITAITQAGQTFLRWTVGANTYMTNPLALPITADMAGQTITAEFATLIQAGFPLWLIPVGVVGAVGTWYMVKGDKHKRKR